MATTKSRVWINFGEFFEEASIKGISELDAAEALLSALRLRVHAYGHRRRYFTDGSELLPRDIQPQRVPVELWREIQDVAPDLSSRWVDDEGDPEQWVNVDWVSGNLNSGIWDLGTITFLLRNYHALRIPAADGKKILSSLTGAPLKRRGAPAGPRCSKERTLVALGFDRWVKEGGDQPGGPSVAKIATELCDINLSADDFENQKRRIHAGIKTIIDRR
ncbi:hypothetical protein H0274_13725 [Altererythrobacter sp. CC-YST694]|uniref:hypothetical protein n=1 Tax=Altererythrobacter sp. CC-YST694 TaxID=2755038 RepID=UPI001D0220FD|nr:hypothetical protein [Altererythrobacter sp. CC-YST694]MCB5426322.1 hypothetical protein [Altererythrobacter sp. CC-YST694]